MFWFRFRYQRAVQLKQRSQSGFARASACDGRLQLEPRTKRCHHLQLEREKPTKRFALGSHNDVLLCRCSKLLLQMRKSGCADGN
jgi:hypothetical protein